MNYEKIKSIVEAVEASGREYYEFKDADELLKHFGHGAPDDTALLIFDEACRHGGTVLPPMLRRLELAEIGVNCDGPDYWLTKLENKYEIPSA